MQRPKSTVGNALALALTLAFVPAATAPVSNAAPAQWRSNRLSTSREKNGRETRKLFNEVVAKQRESIVRFLDDRGRELALGAVVDAGGFVLTKASTILDFTRCLLNDGRRVEGRIFGLSEDYDIALVKLAVGDLRPIEWEVEDPSIGQWLLTPGGRSDTPVGLGVASVPARAIDVRRSMLGIFLDERARAATVSGVQPKSGAERAGLVVGDVIEKIEGHAVRNSEALIERIKSYRVGKRVRAQVLRDGRRMDLDILLGPRDMTPDDELLGGDLSVVRSGFPRALQHDTPLDPRQCGGPLLDIDGKARALNIARSSRTASYAIPAADIMKLLPDMLAGNMPPGGRITSAADSDESETRSL